MKSIGKWGFVIMGILKTCGSHDHKGPKMLGLDELGDHQSSGSYEHGVGLSCGALKHVDNNQ